MIDHDRLFKELLTTFFGDFVGVFLPELAGYLDLATVDFLDKELFSGLAPGERQEADIVVRARFREQQAFFLVHLEHQAQVQAGFGRRLFRYFARLHEKYELPVYPVALFSHEGLRPEPDLYQVTFPDREVLRFSYRAIQLNQLHWQNFVQRPSPTAAALMARMAVRVEERPRVKLECLRLLTRLDLAPAQTRFLSGFIDTYLRLNSQESLLFQAQADRLLDRTEKTKVIELTTSWKEEGRKEGRQEGRLEGRNEERLELVLRLLQRRCDALPTRVESQVRSLPPSTLEQLAEALLDFSALADLEGWLGRLGPRQARP